ncbi:AraC family transcriptional regulator [Ulvibacter sp. MAR_2010_11]|nr:AraC family transcriptional regulator [Ulvibacter sp. MAR_2010_11]
MFVDFILIAGMSLLGLFVIFLLKSHTSFSKKLLILFFASSFFFLLYYYSYLHRSQVLGAVAILFGNGAGFLLGPVLLFYIKSLIFPKEKIVRPLLLHLTPFYIFWFLVSLPIALSLGANIFRSYHDNYMIVGDYINIGENIYFIVYAFLALQLVKQINRGSEESYSFIDENNLRWAEYLIIGLMGIIILDSFFSVYELIFPPISWNIGTVIAFLFVGLYSFLGYKGMFQSNILLPNFLIVDVSTVDIKESEIKPDSKLQRPIRHLDTFSEIEINQLKEKLYSLLEGDKIYLNESLSLSDISNELKITDKKLSELLNQHLNINFYNFINEYRVAEVKERLQNPENAKYTLLGIAYDCGFQSKASFNRIFKQKTGMSPSKYRKMVAST